jgi:hypothetical protein
MSAQRRGLGVGVALLVALGSCGACGELTGANYRSFNLRAMSSEGRLLSSCLSTTTSCEWQGALTGEALALRCPQLPCADDIKARKRYRATNERGRAIVEGVDVFPAMRGDRWVGVSGAALHCVDKTTMPGPIEGWLSGRAYEPKVEVLPDPRCR